MSKKNVTRRRGGNKPAALTLVGPGEWSVRLRVGSAPRLRYRVRAATDDGATKTVALMQRAAAVLADRPDAALRALRGIGTAGTLEEARAYLAAAEQVAKRKAPAPAVTAPAVLTFRRVADRWASGELARTYPDHVRQKRSAETDRHRLTLLCGIIGDVPMADFALSDADRAMAAIPSDRAPATRRQYAQLISRICGLAVYPLQALERSPIPRGWLPSNVCRKAKSYLYPAEDAALLACSAVPLDYRVLYGLLAREGMRLGEARALAWRDVDLVRGSVTLDRNKSDDPRAWATTPGVADALRAYRDLQRPVPAAGALIFGGVADASLATVFREHLALAGVARTELFARTTARIPIRAHDLRATFVTLNLAAGRSEAWISDRTGHKSSVMINRYRRAARHASELGLGEPAPLNEAIPELAGVGHEVGHAVGHEVGHEKKSARFSVSRDGIEPPTRGFSKRTRTSTNAHDEANMLGQVAGSAPTTPMAHQNGPGGPREPGQTMSPVGHATHPVEASLAEAIASATAAGKWDVVTDLSRLLAERQRLRAGPTVASLDAARARKDGGK